MTTHGKKPDTARLDRIVADARRASDERAKGYREQALKLFPWICGRCAREFDRTNVHQLTVHHRDHDHHHNPPDGSNWELLCVYCHDNEHSRELEAAANGPPVTDEPTSPATHRPFADLAKRLKRGGGEPAS
jgi:5-methylcytosine-specific restriction endonuclease McrA